MLKDIVARFINTDDDVLIERFGSGHINDTFKVTQAGGEVFLLQRINHYVFKNVAGLINNMLLVTAHIKNRRHLWLPTQTQMVQLLPCANGEYFTQHADGSYWRMTNFLAHTRSYNVVTTTRQAYQGGAAYGNFQYLLSNMPADQLVATIPDFLNIEFRLQQFEAAIAANKAGRLPTVLAEIAFLKNHADNMEQLLRWAREGVLPLRITHNDTKFNNILLNTNDDIACVIDLDTVMPGYVAYDFGDAVRSIINTAPEDEANLSNIQLNIPLFKAFVGGYLNTTQAFLTAQERLSLINGTLLMPYMQAVRFLTDYLDGDIYYKVNFRQHNLQRTRAQMQLFSLINNNRHELQHIIEQQWLHIQKHTDVA